ncbi:MAG: hypothetical protein IH609_11770 [Dehalococcoidia bacterium]|nr:hypothetical protein [Dehalococcoidia bacterium]
MTGDDEVLIGKVAAKLRALGLNAVSWNSGGGVEGVGIAPGGTPPDELLFYFGTADDVWAGEVLSDDGEVTGGVATTVDSASVNPDEIATGILRAIAEYAVGASA